MLITTHGMVNRTHVREIRVIGRNTQGVRIMNLNEGDKIASVAKVDDQMTVASGGEPAATYREVKSGDTLSKIAKEAYGDANAYMKIFEANKPMLSDPDKIYPGQKLRIPPK